MGVWGTTAVRRERDGSAPLPAGSALWDLPGVYVSAHSSVSIDRYMDDVFDLFADNLSRYLRGEPLRNVIDMQALGF